MDESTIAASLKQPLRSSKKAEWVLAVKADKPSFILRVYIVEEKNSCL